MRENAIQDHKNSLLSSQDSGQTELKVSELTMKSIEFSQISQNSIVMEWMQFRAPRSAGRIGRAAAATAARWRSWWALMVVGLRTLVSTRLLVSAADLYGGTGLRERASACFLAGVGDCELSQHLAHRRLHLRHGSGRLDYVYP